MNTAPKARKSSRRLFLWQTKSTTRFCRASKVNPHKTKQSFSFGKGSVFLRSYHFDRMLHFPPDFWRILNFFSSARGKLPILPYPALCCLQYFPRRNDKYQSPYLVKHVSMIYHIVAPCNNYHNSCFIIIFCCFISFSFIFFTLLFFVVLF